MTTKSENGAGEEKERNLGGGPVEEGLGEVQKNTRTQGTRKIAQINEKTDRKTAKGLYIREGQVGRAGLRLSGPEPGWESGTKLTGSWLGHTFRRFLEQKKFNDRRITKKKSSIIFCRKGGDQNEPGRRGSTKKVEKSEIAEEQWPHQEVRASGLAWCPFEAIWSLEAIW